VVADVSKDYNASIFQGQALHQNGMQALHKNASWTALNSSGISSTTVPITQCYILEGCSNTTVRT